MNYLILLQLLAPEAILTVTALLVLGVGFSAWGSRQVLVLLSLVGCFAAGASLSFLPTANIYMVGGMLAMGPLAAFFKGILIGLAAVTIVFSRTGGVRTHFAEYLSLLLFATVGMTLLISSEELLMIFVALELTSISLYALAAFRKESRASAEAGLKYFLVGGVSAAFLLFGLSLIYGVAGTTSLHALASIPPALAGDPLMLAGIVLTLGGFAFKVAAVPFHLWAPDVYQGAPTSAAAFIASGSKVAGVFILAKMLALGLAATSGVGCMAGWTAWVPLLAIMAAASVLLGNIAALVQSNVARILAYSAIAHGGYMLIGFTSASIPGFTAVLFYVIIYAITTLGAFGIISLVKTRRGSANLRDFDGLAKTSPLVAICLLVFLISLAGIPPFAGFFGKFYLFAEALKGASAGPAPGIFWLVAAAIALNAVSLYYYLIILKHAFVMPAPAETKHSQAPISGDTLLLVIALAAAVLLLGLFPGVLLEPLRAVISNYLTTFL